MSLLMARPSFEDLFRPNDEDFRRDPYPAFAEIRIHHPVAYGVDGSWFVSRYADVMQVIRSRTTVRRGPDGYRGTLPWYDEAKYPNLSGVVRNGLTLRDGDDHRRIRKLVAKAFTPRALERIREPVSRIAGQLLDDVSGEPVNVVSTISAEMPVLVMEELLDLPASDRNTLRQFAGRAANAVNPFLSEGDLRYLDGFQEEMDARLGELVDERKLNPGEDLISNLAQAEEDGDTLSRSEAIAAITQILSGGIASTKGALTLAVLTLARHDGQYQKLLEEPGLAQPAFEEVLRYDPPSQMLRRIATEPMEVAGATIPPGGRIRPLLGAASRDPEAYANPDSFDITRFATPGQPQLTTFGHGGHACPGRALALMEGTALVAGLAARFSKLELLEEPVISVAFHPRHYQTVSVRMVRG